MKNGESKVMIRSRFKSKEERLQFSQAKWGKLNAVERLMSMLEMLIPNEWTETKLEVTAQKMLETILDKDWTRPSESGGKVLGFHNEKPVMVELLTKGGIHVSSGVPPHLMKAFVTLLIK